MRRPKDAAEGYEPIVKLKGSGQSRPRPRLGACSQGLLPAPAHPDSTGASAFLSESLIPNHFSDVDVSLIVTGFTGYRITYRGLARVVAQGARSYIHN